jgi:hypothetical protein
MDDVAGVARAFFDGDGVSEPEVELDFLIGFRFLGVMGTSFSLAEGDGDSSSLLTGISLIFDFRG